MIYLDNAATTLRKPPAVSNAMIWALRHAGGVGRSAHKPALIGAEILYDTRLMAAQLFGLDDPRRVIFTCNATHALNLALHAMPHCRHFAISPFEHNAVLRPVMELVKKQHAKVTILDGKLWDDSVLLESAQKAIENGADCFVLCHVSNVYGYIQPLRQLDDLLCVHGIPLILDASQSAGTIPLNVREYPSLAAVCMPGHKGLYGTTGTGLLLWTAEELPMPLMLGGTGSASENLEMPDFLPDRMECGTHNTAGIAGLFEGMKFIQKIGEQDILQHECMLRERIEAKLRGIPGIQMLHAPKTEQQTGVLSFVSRQLPAETVAQRLAEKGICVRAGLHCAPLAHRTGGTIAGGTIRISPGWFETKRQTESFCRALAQISGKEKEQNFDQTIHTM